MKLRLTFVLLLMQMLSTAQTYSVSGYVKDATSGEPLLFANCYDTISLRGTTTNDYGYYNLQLSAGKAQIKTSYLGYESKTIEIDVAIDQHLDIELQPIRKEIEEVIVNAHTPIHEQVLMGKTTITPKTIKAIPSFLGEPDMMKSISFMPGVSSGREGYSNIYVRGGDRGQNLILLDGMKLYNTNHVGGFTSLINTEIVKSVDVYKGGFPSQYGGRASSVIDIHTKDGNSKEWHGSFTLGLISSGLLVEGPITPKINMMLAARSSYYTLFTLKNRKIYKNIKYGNASVTDFYLYDINGKINWNISDKQRLSISVYNGMDNMIDKYKQVSKQKGIEYEEHEEFKIGNTGVSLLYNNAISQKVFWKNTIAYSRYSNCAKEKAIEYQSIPPENTENEVSSNIGDISFGSRLEIFASSRNTIKLGFEADAYNFMPGKQTTKNQENGLILDTLYGYTSDIEAQEISIYGEDEMNLGTKAKLNIGVRGTSFLCEGKTFYRIEPRISLRNMLTERLSAKANFTVMNQYNHVFVNRQDIFEREIWIAALKDLPPERAEQVSAGLFYGNNETTLECSLEGYYKRMHHLIEYRSPLKERGNYDNLSNITANEGEGESYGVELMINKDFRNVTTILSYTLSWNNRQFDNLNNGKWFPFKYDRRHDVSFVSMWRINQKYSINGNFIFSSGLPCTLPVAYSGYDDLFEDYYIYEGINNYRMPCYHRLDVSVVRRTKTLKGNPQTWTFNIFNLYAHQNPDYVYFDDGKLYQRSFFLILPTVSYSLQF